MKVPIRSSRWARTVAGTVGVTAVLASCGGHHSRHPLSAAPTTTTTAPATTTKPKARPINRCPLTDLPAPKGGVPARQALAVKMDNLNAARPQYGLDAADVVVEEPVEGGITRFIVIYQCHDAPRVEPIRSGRIIDPQILQQFGPHPLIAYAGGIEAAVAAIQSSPLVDVGVFRAPPSDFSRDPNRPAPHNLVSSTQVLYASGARAAPAVAPRPVFKFGAIRSAATPAALVNIGYQYSNLTWSWQPRQRVYYRSYADTGAAIDAATGAPVSTTNIVILKVVMYPSQYSEDPTGTHENLLVLTGGGPAQIIRSGALITGTWVRPNLGDVTKLVDTRGREIALAPGNTWIELVPTTVGVTVTP